jgi:hypothetical protein
MRIESTSFTDADYDAIVEGYFERERRMLIERLRALPDQVDELVPSLDGVGRSDEQAWNALETLAHMAIGVQFFGWAIHEVSQGKDIGAHIQEMIKLRDPSMIDALQQPPEVLAKQFRDGVERTSTFVETVPFDDLRNAVTFGSRQLSAEDFTRISLVHHLEDHVEQMRAAIS